MMVKYPKIETLFDRDEQTFRIIEGKYRREEFESVTRWEVTEKLDGTNVRIHFDPAEPGVVRFGGRTDAAQMQATLLAFLQDTFTWDRALAALKLEDAPVTLFGEGYGPKIQKGGGDYRSDPSVRLFDALVGRTWLRMDSLQEIALGFGVKTVPSFGVMTTADAVDAARSGFSSTVAIEEAGKQHDAEGIVARSYPLMLDRMGSRVMWKLKARDWKGGKL